MTNRRRPSPWTTMLLFALVFSVTSTALVGLAALGKDGYYVGILVVLAASVGVVWYALAVIGDKQQRHRYSAWRGGLIPQPKSAVKQRAQISIRTLLLMTVVTALLLAAIRSHGYTHLLVVLIPVIGLAAVGAFENPLPNARLGPLRGRAMNGCLGGALGGLVAAGLTVTAGIYTHNLELLSLRTAHLFAWWGFWSGFGGTLLGLVASAGDYSRTPARPAPLLDLPGDLQLVEADPSAAIQNMEACSSR